MLKSAIIDPRTNKAAVLDDDGRLEVGGRIGSVSVDVPRELGPGWEGVRKFGFNPDTPSGGEVVWDQGVTPYPGFFTAPQDTEIVSASAQDAPGGTGVAQVELTGLNGQWVKTVVPIELNGLTPVPVPGEWLRGYRGFGLGPVGSNLTNVGDIVWRVAGGGTAFAQITASRGQTLMAVYTVEAGVKRAFIASWVCGVSRNQATTAEVELVTRVVGEAQRVRDVVSINTQGSTQVQKPLSPWIEVGAKTDIFVNVSQAGTSNLGINAGFTVYIEKE